MIKWYAVHLPTHVVNGITKTPISMVSDDSQGFNLVALQNQFGASNVVEIPRQPGVGEKYDVASKTIVALPAKSPKIKMAPYPFDQTSVSATNELLMDALKGIERRLRKLGG